MKENQENQRHGAHQKGSIFYCPMKCEGEKTYDKPGNCPVCNMHLIPIGEKHHH
jgi:hypothetical protein